MNKNKKGFTLVELLVAIAITTIIIAIPLSFLIKELRNTIKETNISQTTLENIVSSSVIGRDVELAGYGLPWNVAGVSYSDITPSVPEYSVNLSIFNTSPPESPKPIDGIRDSGGKGFSYLVIRGSALGLSKACNHWTYISGYNTVNVWPDNSTKAYSNFQQGDKVIVLNSVNRRIVPSSNGFYFTILKDFTPSDTSSSDYGLPTNLPEPQSTYLVYGVSRTANPTMPYNRLDYYLHKPSVMPKNCATGTYILYRNASYPVLSCVADFQVGFGLDTNNDGTIDTWTQNLTTYSALQIRNELKQVRIYVLLQNGVYDRNYTYPFSSVFVGNSNLGIGRAFTFNGITNYKHYRWTVISAVITPKNLGEYK